MADLLSAGLSGSAVCEAATRGEVCVTDTLTGTPRAPPAWDTRSENHSDLHGG